MIRDFKHISRKKSFRLPFFGKARRNAPVPVLPKESKKKRRFLRVLLPLMAILLAAYPVRSVIRENQQTTAARKEHPAYIKTLDVNQSFALCTESLKSSRPGPEGKLTGVLPDGGQVVFSLDRELQERVRRVMSDNQVPYGAFVAIEPKTGRVLAMDGYSALDPSWNGQACFGLYPMASLFKMVTAAAAFEQRKAGPDTVMTFGGRNCSENPRYWTPGRRGQSVNLSVAMGKSINPVFGRLAGEYVGKDYLMTMTERFGFNQTLLPGTPLAASTAPPPQTDSELKLMGAGLGKEVKVSPFHAALIMAALANDGVMPWPVMADRIVNGKGEAVTPGGPGEPRRILAPEVTKQLGKTLSLTVKTGTSRKAFHDRRGRMKLASIDIAAKTGSINGRNPDGHYSWFAAYAPANDPQIALVALVVNRDRWKIKASQLGEQALEAYFR